MWRCDVTGVRLCSDTYPSFIASIICKWPSLVLTVMFVFFLAAAASAALPDFRPVAETNFDTLQIKDHIVAARSFAVDTLEDENSFYVDRGPRPQAARSETQPTDDAGGSTGSEDSSAEDDAAGGGGGEGGSADSEGSSADGEGSSTDSSTDSEDSSADSSSGSEESSTGSAGRSRSDDEERRDRDSRSEPDSGDPSDGGDYAADGSEPFSDFGDYGSDYGTEGGRRRLLARGMTADVHGRLPTGGEWQHAHTALGGHGRGRRLSQFLEGSGVTRMLAVFYRFANGNTAINGDLVAKVRCACSVMCALRSCGATSTPGCRPCSAVMCRRPSVQRRAGLACERTVSCQTGDCPHSGHLHAFAPCCSVPRLDARTAGV